MEQEFYNLTGEPFRLSPDHHFCYNHKCYAKARAYMAYAFLRAEGFVMITGRPGTGKTTLIGELIESLADENVQTANLVCTQLRADDLLKVTAYDFGIDHSIVEKGELLQHLSILLRRWHREGRRALLIVDEAQDLSQSAMEELRLLTNIQEDGKPLLQIFLLGQPELRDLVLSPALEQVHQRIVAASHLTALERDETEAYILHRLKKVGWQGDPALSKTIFPLIHRFSEGVPRRINLICSRLFLHGCVEQRHQLGVADLKEVIKELQGENLAAGTYFSEEEFQIGDEFEPVENESADVTTPPNSGPASAEEKEYPHAVGDDVGLHLDAVTGKPIPEGEKKNEVVALRPASPNPGDTLGATQKRQTPTSVKPPPTVAKTRTSQRKTPTEISQNAPPETDSQLSPATNRPSLATDAPERARHPRRTQNKTEPQRFATGKWAILTIIILVILLVLGWLAFDSGLINTQAWRNQIDEWQQSISPSVDQSRFRLEPETRPLPQSAVQIEPESEPRPALQTEQPPEPFVEDSWPQHQPEVSIDPASDSGSESAQEIISDTLPTSLQIVFGFDSAELSEGAKENLDEFARALLPSDSSRIKIMGFADETGDRNYNFALSRHRADAVAEYLVARGVDRQFLVVQGLGIYSTADAAPPDPATPGSNGRVVRLEVQAH